MSVPNYKNFTKKNHTYKYKRLYNISFSFILPQNVFNSEQNPKYDLIQHDDEKTKNNWNVYYYY